MTATQPTGELMTDAIIFLATFALMLAMVWLDGARRIKKGKWD